MDSWRSCPAMNRPPIPPLPDELLQRAPKLGRPLSHCANLAVPASASTTLSLLLERALRAVNVSPPRTPWGRIGYSHHKHMVRPHHLYRAGARCFIVTLRDPADRLATTVAWESDFANRMSSHTEHIYSSGSTRTTSDFVDALMNQTSKYHERSKNLYRTSLPGFFFLGNLQKAAKQKGKVCPKSVWQHADPFRWETTTGERCCQPINDQNRAHLVSLLSSNTSAVREAKDYDGGANGTCVTAAPALSGLHGREKTYMGDNFLIPQLHWISELGNSQYDNVDLHFVCVNNLTSSWRGVLSRFDDELARAGAGPGTATRDSIEGDLRANPSRQRSSSKSEQFGYREMAQREFVRRCLYPEDSALWRRICLRS